MKREDLLGTEFACECGKTHNVPTRRVAIGRGVLTDAPRVLADLRLGGDVFLVADPTTYEVAGRRLTSLLEAAGHRVERCLLPEHPVAGDETRAYVRERYRPCTVVISCGSGTITDLGKSIAHEQGVPFVAVATAPSMNGYASNIIAVMHDGVKITEPVTPACAVIADVDILAAAPLDMTRAGLGDALAKPVCNADWKLSSLIKGEHFCGRAFTLVRDVEKIYIARAAEIGRRDPEAVAALSEALVYSGISMVLAGSSSPASGGEHLISHTLDMHAASAGREKDFHGAQVGVGTLITSALYERLCALTAEEVAGRLSQGDGPAHDEVIKRVRNFFGPLSIKVEEQYAKKMLAPDARRAERQQLLAQWDRVREEVRPFLMSSRELRSILGAAGAKTRYDELGVTREEFHETVYLARAIRPRYTILDVAWELGMLEDFIKEML